MKTAIPPASQTLAPATWDDFLGVMKQVEREVTLIHRQRFGSEKVTFRTAVKDLLHVDTSMAWLDTLHPYIDIRNAYAHNPSLHPPALIPSKELIQEATALYERLRYPSKVLEKYGQSRKVVTVKPTTRLTTVLRFIGENDFSQFPIYVDGNVVGLLTEKTITRWLAKRYVDQATLSVTDITIADIVSTQTVSTRNFRFVSSKERADTVSQLFIDNIDLEAAIIVRSMNAPMGVCGIVTTWDVMNTGSVQ